MGKLLLLLLLYIEINKLPSFCFNELQAMLDITNTILNDTKIHVFNIKLKTLNYIMPSTNNSSDQTP